MTSYINKLPSIFQTTVEKGFFDSTIDQFFAKKDSSLLSGYMGRRVPGSYNAITDFYIPEPTKDRTWWQLEATAYSKDASSNKTNILFYEDLLNYINYYGGNTLNQDRLFESQYYSFGPPIDYDMFINYTNYYWIEQGLPAIVITGILASDVIGQTTYTTPSTATPPNLLLTTGMTIQIIGDPEYSVSHIVENIGGCTGIRLVPLVADFSVGTAFEFLPWDSATTLSTGRVINNVKWDGTTWETQTEPSNGDYITIERGSLDKNAWSRSNKWFHIDAIRATITASSTSFPTNATRALRPIVQFIADLILYNSGSQFNSNITYGFKNESKGNAILLSELDGQKVNDVNAEYGTNFAGGEVVSFFNDILTNTNFYRAYLSGGIITFVLYSSPVVEGDIVFVTESGPYDSAQRGQTWYYESGVWLEAFNDKYSLNQAPLFQLYDHDAVKLNNVAKYPDSTFEGSKIFSYAVDTTPNAPVDPILKFAILYTALGQSSDILFENNLITNRYTYGTNLRNVDGYYYYKTITNPVLYNSWNLYEPQSCSTASASSVTNGITVSKQRVIDNFVVGYGTEFQFGLSVTPYNYPDTPDIIVSVNNIIVPQAQGTSVGWRLTEINNQIYVDLSSYLLPMSLTTQVQPPVVEVQTYTRDTLDPAATGYFEIPQQLEANPTQQEITTISGSNLIQQFSSIITGQVGSTGTAFGGPNNYRDTPKNRSVGSFILQNVTPVLKAMLPMSDTNLDFITAERFSSDEYTKFKNKYLKTALQLINRNFDPVQYHNNTIIINTWVEEILNTINIANEFSNAFAYSYMIANGSPFANETDMIPPSGLLQLTNYIDLTDVRNSLYIYATTSNENLLIIGEDYEIVSTNLEIAIQFNLSSSNVQIGNAVTINLYKNPLPAYIPSTPTKIGAYAAYLPRIELDHTYLVPALVVIGHDGSKTLAYGDYRDQLLLDLEKRIYNLLQTDFRNEHYLPIRLESIKTGYYRQTRYTTNEYLSITESYINKWAAKNKANYRANDWDTSSLSPAVVPSFTPGVGNIWKLYNYTRAVQSGTNQSLNLPGNWKGIFQFYFDTIYPDTRPWELLGFSEQPSWWITEYGEPVTNMAGQKVWTSTAQGLNVMWQDLENGIIRQGPSAIYDPVTLLPQMQIMWQRQGLAANIPVNSAGEIISVMEMFNVAFSENYYEPFDNFKMEWAYGDGSPVEQAWTSSSAYAFSVQEFMYLMQPAQYGEYMWDTVGIQISTGMISVPTSVTDVMSNTNWQFVQNDTYASTSTDPQFSWMRPKNINQYVHAENLDSVVQIRFGYQRWISDRIMFLNMNVTNTFGQKIRTLNVNLANKFAGFTNKDTTNLYIEAVSPTSSTNTLIIPSTNYDVILYTSPVVESYSYSGIIIRALADGTFNVYGYDLLKSSFTVLERSDSSIINVSVGGTPAPFQYYAQGATYNPGDIVRYNGIYYQSLVIQKVNTFISNNFKKLPGLPTIGGISVNYKPNSLTTTRTYPYGVVVSSVQEVFDLMIGYGAFLETQGWQFENVDATTNIVSNWLSSAKQFLFWLNTDWAPDASIQLSPLANSATIIVDKGYPNDVERLSNGVYSILDKYGIAIPSAEITTERDGMSMTVSPNSVNAGGIYYLQVNTSTTEHILIFDNVTSFSDTIYDPLLLARQERLRFNGFRTNGWHGKMEAAGYIIMGNTLVPNFDTIVDSMRYFYDPNVVLDNTSLEDLGHHLIGYESKSYLDNMQVDANVQYMFYQGSIRQKGTTQALNSLFRSNIIQNNEDITIYEEWALKLGEFGNTIEQVSTEFILKPEQNTGKVIVARLNFVPAHIGFVREINILNAQDIYATVPKITIAGPDATPNVTYSAFSVSSTYVEGQVINYPDAQGNESYYSSNIIQGPGPFILANWTLILTTRIAKAYAVLDNAGRITRVDITDPGTGYLNNPVVLVRSPTDASVLDQLYSVWQGEIVIDTAVNNIIDISIDDPILWTIRPNDPEYASKFPLTNKIEYPIPNAGYVNTQDVDWMSFDVTRTTVNWGTAGLNPAANNTVWIAKTFTHDWSVFKMTELSDKWRVAADYSNNLILLTTYGVSSSLTVESSSGGSDAILVPVVNAAGNITSVNIIGAGIDYNIADTITAIRALPYSAAYVDATFTIDSVSITGEITAISVLNPTLNTGYAPIPNVTIVPQLWPVAGTHRTQFGNTISLQQVVDGAPVPANNYAVGYLPYTSTDYNAPGTYTDPITLVTYNAYYLTTLSGAQITSTDIGNYSDFTDVLLFSSMRFNIIPSIVPAYVSINDKIWVDNGSVWDPINTVWSAPDNLWSVYTRVLPINRTFASLILFRQQEALINTTLFESASVYSTTTDVQLTQLPIYDPFKNILPGPAKQNITYTTVQDPARYNVTGNAALFSENISFASQQVGQIWWDLSSAAYLYYEQPIALDGSETAQDNLVYRRNNWGQLFAGSKIAIYEWTQSSLPPAKYTGSGTPKDITTYVQITSSNVFTGASVTNYYFWVSGVTTQPNLINRTMPAVDIALMLQSPLSQGFVFFSPIQQSSTNNSYMFYNVLEILAYQGNNIQIKYRQADRNDQTHAQWMFFREGDPASIVTNQYWNKMVDSLCGFTQAFPYTDGYNGIIVADNLPWDMFGWDISPWDDATSTTTPSYGVVLAVPDPTLSAGEAYGIEYRPRQSMFVSQANALKVFTIAANSLLQYIPIRDNNANWGATLPNWSEKTGTDEYYGTYWIYKNWYLKGYENSMPTVVFQTIAQANVALLAGQLLITDIVEVTNGTADGRFVLFAVKQVASNAALSFLEIGIQNSAILLMNSIYTTKNMYSLPKELRSLLYTFRTQVMVSEYIVDQNELFFSMINYVMSEQRNPNWVFKSSYIYVSENNKPLSQPTLYKPDQIDNILAFITDSKPYHTQVRDYTSSYITTDVAAGTANDSRKWSLKLQFGPDHAGDVYDVPSYILNAENLSINIDQFVAREDVFTFPLTTVDPSKVGYSSLYPYTFTADTVFGIYGLVPQTLITPHDIVGIQIGVHTLVYGRDYFVLFNNDNTATADGTYTVYFFQDPSAGPVPVALVLFDGGSLFFKNTDTYRSETAVGIATDDLVAIIDTQLPLNLIGTTYSAFNDMWDLHDPVISTIIATLNGENMGFGNSLWDQSSLANSSLVYNTITSRENLNTEEAPTFYRDAQVSQGVLVHDLLSYRPKNPVDKLPANYDVITIYVDPDSHTVTDILPEPGNSYAAIWIGGERIEYRLKTETGTLNTWELRTLLRGANQTGITSHIAGTNIWIEQDNIIPGTPDLSIWNTIDASGTYQQWNKLVTYYAGDIIIYQGVTYITDTTIIPFGITPDMNPYWKVMSKGKIFTSITSTPLGGLWYAQTPEAKFLKKGLSTVPIIRPAPVSSFPVQLTNLGATIIGGPVSKFPAHLKTSGLPPPVASVFPVQLTNYGTPIIGGPVSKFPVKLSVYGIPIVGGPVSNFPVKLSVYGTPIIGGPVSSFPVKLNNAGVPPVIVTPSFPVQLTSYGTSIVGGPVSSFPTKLTSYGTPIIGGLVSSFPAKLSSYGTPIAGGPVSSFPVQLTH